MNFLFRWLSKKIRQAEDEATIEYCEKGISLASSSDHDINIRTSGMNFTVYKANGGMVIERKQYDTKNDRWNTSLHIVTSDQDLGTEIGKIITYESLLH